MIANTDYPIPLSF